VKVRSSATWPFDEDGLDPVELIGAVLPHATDASRTRVEKVRARPEVRADTAE